MTGTERAVRVFISSTFRDMQEEREELVKRVFPELRRRCEERGVTWGEVDLRWGVTDEEKAEGAVLPICLAEIEQTRPYFIGLLGERYGWVPDEIDGDLRDRLPWLGEFAGRSVTELEILHGVLNDPAMEHRAFFYLRDPAYVASLPEPERTIHLELPSHDEVQRLGADGAAAAADRRRRSLVELKDRIRGTAFPVRDGYADPIELGRMVLDDVGAMIDRLFPAETVDDPADREDREHAAFAAARSSLYIGAERRTAALASIVAAHPAVLVTGEPGVGKSALLASWARITPADGAEVVTHHVGATADSTDWVAMLRRLVGRIAPDAPVGDTVDPDAVKGLFADALRRRGEQGPVVLVLDGLDQLDDRDHAPDLAWLPWELPPGVRIVAAASGERTLEAAYARGFHTHPVPLLDDGERGELVVDFLSRYSKRLAGDLIERIVMVPHAGNPRFARAVLDELRQHGDHFTLVALLDDYLAVDTIDDLFEHILARWERDYERDRPGLVAEAFTLIAASRTGLSEPELLGLLGAHAGGMGAPLPHAVWAPLYLAAGEALMRRSGRLAVAHHHLDQAIVDRYLGDADDRRRVHRRLADAFAIDPTPHALSELPWQLRHAAEWERLVAVLTDPARLEPLFRTDLAEVRTGWAALEGDGGQRMIDAYRPVVDDPAAHAAIAWEVARLLTDAGYPAEAIILHRVLVARARQGGDDARLQASLGNLAAAELERGELAAAEEALAEQERICRATGDETSLHMALGNRGVLLRRRGDHTGALAVHAVEEEIWRRLGDLPGLQASLGNQGAVRRDQRDFDGALRCFDEQEQVARRIGDGTLINKALVNRAQVLADRGDVDEALALLARQETECRIHGDLAALTANQVNRAAILIQQGRFDEAGPPVTEAADGARRLGDDEALARVLFQQAHMAQLRGDRDTALRSLAEHQDLVAGMGDRSLLAAGLGMRATLAREAGNLDGALGLHIEEEHIYRQVGDVSGIAASLGNQALVRNAQGDAPAAMALIVEQERILRPLDLPSMLQVVLGNKAAFLLGAGDIDGAAAALDEQETLCRRIDHRHGLAGCLGNQGLVLHRRGDLAGAAAKHREQERMCRELEDPTGLATSLGNQAAVAVDGGDGPGALRLLDEQLRVASAAGASMAAVHSLVVQMRIRPALGDLAGLQASVAAAEATARATADTYLLAQCLAMRGSMAMGQPSAAALLAEAEQAAQTSGNPHALQLAVGNRGLMLIQTGDLDGAEAALRLQEETSRRHGIPEGLSAALGNLAIVLRQQGDLAGALALLEEQEGLCRANGDAPGLVLALANRGEVTTGFPERRGEGIALLQQAAELADQIGWAPMAAQIRQLAGRLGG